MRNDPVPVLLTSAITATAPFTKMSDSKARLAATISAVRRWMALSDARLVICDGSGYDLSRELEACHGVDPRRIEVITFQNDRAQVMAKGKGYGEGEIIRYALEHSLTLKAADAFAKCTGKLWVDNYPACRRAFNGSAGFSYFGFLKVLAVDTRFFMVSREFFESNLLQCYTRCDDAKKKYLENVYLKSLNATPRVNWMLSTYPIIRGLSGTSGAEYRRDVLKRIGKTLAIRIVRYRHAGPPSRGT